MRFSIFQLALHVAFLPGSGSAVRPSELGEAQLRNVQAPAAPSTNASAEVTANESAVAAANASENGTTPAEMGADYQVDPMAGAQPENKTENPAQIATDVEDTIAAAVAGNESAANVTAEVAAAEALTLQWFLSKLKSKCSPLNMTGGLCAWIFLAVAIVTISRAKQNPEIGIASCCCMLCCVPVGFLSFLFPIDEGSKPPEAGEDEEEADPNKIHGPKLKLIDFAPTGGDADKFIAAHEATDIWGLVALLTSTQEVASVEDRMHPWAEDPKTVGAMSALHIGLLASRASEFHGVKSLANQAGAVPLLVALLRADAVDQNHAGVVALYHLTTECPAACHCAYKEGAVSVLLKFRDSITVGFRCAAISTLCNICRTSKEYWDSLAKMNHGIRAVVEQLTPIRNPAMNIAASQLETILNLQDVIEEIDGTLIEENADRALHVGALPKLKVLMESKDEDVKEAAEEVYERLHTRYKAAHEVSK